MPVDTLLAAAVELLVLGMGGVFVILGLLIGCMVLLNHFAPKEEPPATMPDTGPEVPLVAAIQCAIHQYRTRRPVH